MFEIICFLLVLLPKINNFIKNIIYLREKHSFSKETMAKKLGISVYSLNLIEKGQIPKGVTVEILFKIEKEFGLLPSQQFVKLKK